MSREHKSDVFSMLMEEKMRALELYNAMGGTNYTDPNELIIVKLEKGVSLTIRNDASFIVDFNFQFFEHQSTYNPNMPLRSMLYFANAMEDSCRLLLFCGESTGIPEERRGCTGSSEQCN